MVAQTPSQNSIGVAFTAGCSAIDLLAIILGMPLWYLAWYDGAGGNCD